MITKTRKYIIIGSPNLNNAPESASEIALHEYVSRAVKISRWLMARLNLNIKQIRIFSKNAQSESLCLNDLTS
jgi:hypothetical protein